MSPSHQSLWLPWCIQSCNSQLFSKYSKYYEMSTQLMTHPYFILSGWNLFKSCKYHMKLIWIDELVEFKQLKRVSKYMLTILNFAKMIICVWSQTTSVYPNYDFHLGWRTIDIWPTHSFDWINVQLSVEVTPLNLQLCAIFNWLYIIIRIKLPGKIFAMSEG